MYSVLLGVDAFLLVRAAKAGPADVQVSPENLAGQEAYVE